MNKAETSGSKGDLEAGEALLDKLVTTDPESETWVRAMRWEMAQLKKRL